MLLVFVHYCGLFSFAVIGWGVATLWIVRKTYSASVIVVSPVSVGRVMALLLIGDTVGVCGSTECVCVGSDVGVGGVEAVCVELRSCDVDVSAVNWCYVDVSSSVRWVVVLVESVSVW